MDPLTLDTRMEIDAAGNAVIHVEGDIDLATSPSLQGALAKALEQSSSIVVDVAGVHFIDSSGLSTLVWGHRGAQEAGGSLRIRRPSAMLRRLLDITALDQLLKIDEDAAPPNPADSEI